LRPEHKILEMTKDPWKDPNPQPGDFDAELSIVVSRATDMRALLRHARPHGGNAAEHVKRTRPRSTRD
jgi:hypothetical protein